VAAAELLRCGDHGKRDQFAVGGEDANPLEGESSIEGISQHREQLAAVEEGLVGVGRLRIAHDQTQIGIGGPLKGCDGFIILGRIEEGLGGARAGRPGIGELDKLLCSEVVEFLVRELRGKSKVLLLLKQPLLRRQKRGEQEQHEQ